MKKVYLIDLENVKNAGLEGVELLSSEESVVIFYSNKADTLKIDTIRNIRESRAEVDYIKADNGTPNALDFQLITYLYYHLVADLSELGWKASDSEETDPVQENEEGRIEGAKDIQYWIISKDTGYEASIRMSRRMGLSNVHRAPAIKNAVHYGQRAEKSAASKSGKNGTVRNEEKAPASGKISENMDQELQDSAETPLTESPVEADNRKMQKKYREETSAEHDRDKEVSAEKTADASVKLFLTPVPADGKNELAQIRQFPLNERRESEKRFYDGQKNPDETDAQQEQQKQNKGQKTDQQKYQENRGDQKSKSGQEQNAQIRGSRQSDPKEKTAGEKQKEQPSDKSTEVNAAENRQSTSLQQDKLKEENGYETSVSSDNRNHSRRNRKDRRDNTRFSDETAENQEKDEGKKHAGSVENSRNNSRKRRGSRKNQQDTGQKGADTPRESRQKGERKGADTVNEIRQDDAQNEADTVSEARRDDARSEAAAVNEVRQDDVRNETDSFNERRQKENVSGDAEKTFKGMKQESRRPVNQALASFLHHKCSVSSDDATVNLVEDALKNSENKSQFYQYFRRRMGASRGSDFYRSIRDQFAAMKEITGSQITDSPEETEEPLEDQQRA